MTMANQTCAQCGFPASGFSPVCPECGAARAARMAPRRRAAFGAAYRSSRPSSLLRGGQVGAAGACVGLMLLGVEGFVPDFRVAMVVAVVMAAVLLMLVSLLLVWSRRTRPFIPFVALALVGGISLMRAVATDLAAFAQRRMMERRMAASGNGSGQVGLNAFLQGAEGGWDGCPVERVKPAFVEYQGQVAARLEWDPNATPSAWPTPRYVAAAGEHPEVGRYMAGLRDFAEEMRGRSPEWLGEHMAEAARSAGRSEAQVHAMLLQCAGGPFREIEQYWVLQKAAAEAGLEYHRYLVSVDARVRYDARLRTAVFDRERDLERARRLARHFDERVAAAGAEESAHRPNVDLLPGR
jgi:hypothetical protein